MTYFWIDHMQALKASAEAHIRGICDPSLPPPPKKKKDSMGEVRSLGFGSSTHRSLEKVCWPVVCGVAARLAVSCVLSSSPGRSSRGWAQGRSCPRSDGTWRACFGCTRLVEAPPPGCPVPLTGRPRVHSRRHYVRTLRCRGRALHAEEWSYGSASAPVQRRRLHIAWIWR